MGFGVLVMGESGSGKSYSLRNFKCSEIGIFNTISKPFPFRGELNRCTMQNSRYRNIAETFSKPLSRRAYVIDDVQYLMAQDSFEHANEQGYGKFTQMAQNYYNLLMSVRNLNEDTIVYFLSHVQRDDFGKYRVKTLGKMLDSQLTVEGVFPIVLFCKNNEDGTYCFETQGNSISTAKSPAGMFKSLQIDNDLKAVDSAIRDFWGMKPLKIEKEEQKEGK